MLFRSGESTMVGQTAHRGDGEEGKSGAEVEEASVSHSGEECGWKGPGSRRMFLKMRVRACADGNRLGGRRRVKVQKRGVNPPSDTMRVTLTLDLDPAPPRAEWKGNAYKAPGGGSWVGRACLALEIENRHW